MHRFIVAGTVAILLVCGLSGAANAFCIYNKTNINISVKQIEGGYQFGNPDGITKGFFVDIKPGGNACCNWKVSDCNRAGKDISMVAFAVYLKALTGRDGFRYNYLLCGAQIPANGWVDVTGNVSSSIPYNPPVNFGDPIGCKGLSGRQYLVGLGGKCLDVSGAEDRNGANVQIHACHGRFNQKFAFLNSGEIKGIGNRCLDVTGAQNRNGANIQMWSCNGAPNQKWRQDGNRMVGLGGKCLDVSGAQNRNGANVQLYDCHGQANQQWKIVGE